MIKAVIFDLDGVLVSTDALHFAAWKQLAQDLGIAGFSEADNARQRGVSRMESLEVVLEKGQKTYSIEEKEALAHKKNEYYVASLAQLGKAALLPGARQTIEMLKNRGVAVALGSASKNAPLILQKIGIAPLFDAVADGHDTTRSKPDPQVFLVAAQKLGMPAENCLVVEDSDAGIEAGAAAGMKTLGVGPAAKNPLANHHATSLADGAINWDAILSAG